MSIDISGAKEVPMLQAEGEKRETPLDEEMVSRRLLSEVFVAHWGVCWAICEL